MLSSSIAHKVALNYYSTFVDLLNLIKSMNTTLSGNSSNTWRAKWEFNHRHRYSLTKT